MPDSPLMRLWRCGRGLLIERPAGQAMIDTLLSASRRMWRTPPMDYWLVDGDGHVIERFAVMAWSLEDELGATLFAIEDRTLVKLEVRAPDRRDATVQSSVALAGLVALPADDAAGLAQARAALARDADRQAEAVRRGEARVAAVAGADDDYGAGEAFRMAQHLLRQRVAAYGEALSESLLAALMRFGTLYAAAPSVEPALAAFVAACRRAAFDRTLTDGGPPVSLVVHDVPFDARDRATAAGLVVTLRDLERVLGEASDDQARVDAMNNAAAYAVAARDVARARIMLDDLLGESA
jgi:hypothetical protein